MIEFLCAVGHDHAFLLDCSLDKLRDLFHDANARRAREQAALELAMMHAVANGAGALMSKKGVNEFNKINKALANQANGTKPKQDVAANLKHLTENLLSIGARRSYAAPKIGPGHGKNPNHP